MKYLILSLILLLLGCSSINTIHCVCDDGTKVTVTYDMDKVNFKCGEGCHLE